MSSNNLLFPLKNFLRKVYSAIFGRLADATLSLPKWSREGDYVTENGQKLHWVLGDTRVDIYTVDNGSQYPVNYNELNLTNNDKVNLFNPILAARRPFAVTDEHGQFTASVVISNSGGIYVSNNNQRENHNPYAGRGCSEQRAMGVMLDNERDGKVRELFLMSGPGEKNKEGKFTEHALGKCGANCGICRSNIYKNGYPETKVYLVPCNDGSATIVFNDKAKCSKDLQNGYASNALPSNTYAAFAVEVKDLIPHLKVNLDNTDEIKTLIKNGLDYITSPETINNAPLFDDGDLHQILKVCKSKLSGKSDYGSNESTVLELINEVLVQAARQSYREHYVDGVQKADVVDIAIVRDVEGNFHFGRKVAGEEHGLKAKPNVFSVTLQHNVPVQEAWVMRVNTKSLNRQIQAWDKDSNEAPRIWVPGGDGRERLIKNSAKNSKTPLIDINGKEMGVEITDSNGRVLNPTNLRLTVIAPNVGGIKEADITKLSRSYGIEELLPDAHPSVQDVRLAEKKQASR